MSDEVEQEKEETEDQQKLEDIYGWFDVGHLANPKMYIPRDFSDAAKPGEMEQILWDLDLGVGFLGPKNLGAGASSTTNHESIIPNILSELLPQGSSSPASPGPFLKLQSNLPVGFNLLKFTTASITNRLMTLGVEELECKEHVETWLSQRRQRRWYQSLKRLMTPTQLRGQMGSHLEQPLVGMVNSSGGLCGDIKWEPQTFSPSKPNSSLLRLSGDGNVELGQFLTRIQDLNGHLNCVTCSLLQGITVLILPYLKLLSGSQLETMCCETFIEEWIQVIVAMTGELKPESGSQAVKAMLEREFHSLRSESRLLYKKTKKMYNRIQKLINESSVVSKKAMVKLHPKGLAGVTKHNKRRVDSARDSNNNSSSSGPSTGKAKGARQSAFVSKMFIPETIQFSPIPLHRANITASDLFKNHIFLSKSKKGDLVVKTDINGEWDSFSKLSFDKRRDLFLSSMEDLRWTLRFPLMGINQLKELLVGGYPENISLKMKANFQYLKKVSKEEDLLVLSRVTIISHLTTFVETMNRLLRTMDDALKLSKYFYHSIKSKKYIHYKSKKEKNSKGADPLQNVERDPRSQIFTDVQLSLKFDNSRVKLLLPYFGSTDNNEDEFFFSSI